MNRTDGDHIFTTFQRHIEKAIDQKFLILKSDIVVSVHFLLYFIFVFGTVQCGVKPIIILEKMNPTRKCRFRLEICSIQW